MDGNRFSKRVTRIMLGPSSVSLCLMMLCLSVVSAESPSAWGQSVGLPEPLRIDEEQIQPIGTVLSETRAAIVRPRSSVHQVDGSDHTATLVVTAADSESTSESTTVSDSSSQESTWLRLQAAQDRDTRTQDQPDTDVKTQPETIDEALDRRGTISFRKTPISEVVFLLSDLWKINIVAGENVSGDVSGTFHDAPLREVLNAVLTASGYSYQRTGRSLVVLPIDEVGSDDPNFVTETLRLPGSGFGESETLEAAQLMLSERGELRKLGNDLVLVVDTKDRIQRVRGLFEQLGSRDVAATPGIEEAELVSQPTGLPSHIASGIAYFSPQFTEASEMAESLTTVLGDGAVIAVYAQENRIMVKGDPDILRLATEAIEQLDVPRAQVRITAMIYDVGLNELERLGVDWSHRPHSSAITTVSPSDTTAVFRNSVNASTGLISDPTASGAANLAIQTLNDSYDASLLLQALSSTAESKLLADPSITVGDRRQASIRIVQRIPIIAADPVENSGVVFSQVQFEEAGVILNVTPRISRDGTIEMQVQPEYSIVVDFIENNPVIDSRTAETTLRVQDGNMFVLGGLRQKAITETVRGVPFLKDMKYVGKLFRAQESQVRESELIVFIKPEIVMACSLGTPREERAKSIAGCELDRIAHADHCPQTPDCGNSQCPNHVPRPRINGGSYGLGMIDGVSEPGVVDHSSPSTSEVISSIENHEVETNHQSESIDRSQVDANTFLRLQSGLQELNDSTTTTRGHVGLTQTASAKKQVAAVHVDVIDDVEPPIYIGQLPHGR